MKFEILSWNIWQGKNLAAVIKYLKTRPVDVIGLQEIVDRGGKDHEGNIAYKIAESLGYECIYYKALKVKHHKIPFDQGNAILTKHPIVDSKRFFLSGQELYKGNAETEPRIAVETDIEINGEVIKLFNVHLAYSHKLLPSPMRALQISNLLTLLKGKRVVLMGDFNSDPEGEDLKPLRDILKSADSVSVQPTWSVYPTDYKGFILKGLEYRIDNIFASKDIKVESFRVEDSSASDHLPISAVLEV